MLGADQDNDDKATVIVFVSPSSIEPTSESVTPSRFLKKANGGSSSSSIVYVYVIEPSTAVSVLLVASYELLSLSWSAPSTSIVTLTVFSSSSSISSDKIGRAIVVAGVVDPAAILKEPLTGV